jgi:hypothetical protein
MNRHVRATALLLALPLAASAAQDPASSKTTVCLAPPSITSAVGNASDAASAVRETFASYLTGPSLSATELTARLESQVRLEASAAACPYLLLTAVKHVRKSGRGILGRMAGSAAQQAAWSVGAATSSTAGRIITSAAAGAAGAAASNYASWMKSKDELTLTYRLESATGAVLVEKTAKRKATSDGEDLITPLVEDAATVISDAVTTHERTP